MNGLGVRIALTAALLLSGCDQIKPRPNSATREAIERGQRTVARLGCGACHEIAGVWPAGTSGPSLLGFGARGNIAGLYANRPDALAAFLLDPAGSAMPRIAMTSREAADMAAFLHAQ